MHAAQFTVTSAIANDIQYVCHVQLPSCTSKHCINKWPAPGKTRYLQVFKSLLEMHWWSTHYRHRPIIGRFADNWYRPISMLV